MTVTINGQPREVPDATSVAHLLERMNLRPQNVAVELNKRLLRSERYDTPLKEGDEVEVVTFVGGG